MPNSPICRGFYHLAEAWYAEANRDPSGRVLDEVMFGDYPPGGGTGGELAIRWHRLGDESVPRLEAFSDSWRVLATFSDLFVWLARHNKEHFSPAHFCAALLDMGFRDLTPRVGPKDKASVPDLRDSAQRLLARLREEGLAKWPEAQRLAMAWQQTKEQPGCTAWTWSPR